MRAAEHALLLDSEQTRERRRIEREHDRRRFELCAGPGNRDIGAIFVEFQRGYLGLEAELHAAAPKFDNPGIDQRAIGGFAEQAERAVSLVARDVIVEA